MTIAASKHKHSNRLINETSPYLLQHADNPVDWYPWGPEAFEKAKKEDKPIFLSIGYSTCHWCHVMEHESFENERTAKIMNEHFISIKVDREQRPDIDAIYMNAVQIMTGSGGWPLSVFLTHDGKPFYGGTYFPPTESYGRPGFGQLLLSISEMWKNDRKKLLGSADKLTDAMKSALASDGKEKITPLVLDKAFDIFQQRFDSFNGGFGVAPKFPQPSNLSMLLVYYQRSKKLEALNMVEQTLEAMANGGIYDQLGGGFHRYATDTKWLVPHFEKMLYDQALISKAYLQAYQITKKQQYAKITQQIFDYVLTQMTDTKGGFYSAEDADSEGEEGIFYIWTPKQIESILDKEQAEIFKAHYGVTKYGNFEHNTTILHIAMPIEKLQKKFKKDHDTILNILQDARSKLFKHRQKRIRPHLDDKVITAWNGLMISSLAYGGTILQQPKYIDAAEKAADFIMNNLYKDGRLIRYYRDGQAVTPAFLDDYAFMTLALLDLYEATFDAKWLATAKELSSQMIDLFADNKHGGFFLTGKDSEKLIARTKPDYDGAVPSGNSIAALALLKMGRLTMDTSFTESAAKAIEAVSKQLQKAPTYSAAMLIALNFWFGPTQEIVIAGNAQDSQTQKMIKTVRDKFLPNAVVLLHEQGKAGEPIEKISPFVKNQITLKGKATAYVCENYVCNQPVNTVKELDKLIIKITASK